MSATKQPPNFHQPRLLTAKVQEVICEAIEKGAKLEIAARAAGIGARTLDEWLHHGRRELQENPDAEGPCAEFVRAVDVASAKFESGCLTIIQDAAAKKWTAAAWLLERRIPKRYAKVDRLRLSGDEQTNKPVHVCNREEVKQKLLEKLAEIAQKNLERQGKSEELEAIDSDLELIVPDRKSMPS